MGVIALVVLFGTGPLRIIECGPRVPTSLNLIANQESGRGAVANSPAIKPRGHVKPFCFFVRYSDIWHPIGSIVVLVEPAPYGLLHWQIFARPLIELAKACGDISILSGHKCWPKNNKQRAFVIPSGSDRVGGMINSNEHSVQDCVGSDTKRHSDMSARSSPDVIVTWSRNRQVCGQDNMFGIEIPVLGDNPPAPPPFFYVFDTRFFKNYSPYLHNSGRETLKVSHRIELSLVRKTQCAGRFKGQWRTRNDICLKAEQACNLSFFFDIRDQGSFASVGIGVFLF